MYFRVVTERVASIIKPHLKTKFVLETNPGFGLISRELVNVTSNLRLYEDNPALLLGLEVIRVECKLRRCFCALQFGINIYRT